MTTTDIKTAGIIRTGFEYQDLIGIELLINFYRNPDLYQWVKLEAEDPTAGHLDDVVAQRKEGNFELTQVKFTVDPDRFFLCWDWLLQKRPNGTSLLKKWAASVRTAAQNGIIHSARLRTNRRPDDEFAKVLEGQRVQWDRVPDDIRSVVGEQVGGADAAKEFFDRFEFAHSEQMFNQLEARLRAAIVPSDTNASGWLLLREQARTWATRKLQPEPDGCIRHEHLVQIITKRRPQPIPQDFQVPEIYCVPRQGFHDAFTHRIKEKQHAVSVLWGSPGRGKSTYLSFLVEQLRKEDIPIVRHHYFLSLQDATHDRVSFTDIATSLMHQMGVRYPDAVEGIEELPDKLREWIIACGTYFKTQGKPFLVVVDGLDHVWREQGNIQQMDHLFNYILPCPPNVLLVVGTQRVPEDQLPHRLLQQATNDDWWEIPPMDEQSVQEWMRGQHEGGRVRLRNGFVDEGQQREEVAKIGRAFFDISEGHPLHLIYSFEALVRRGSFVTEDEVRSLPRCPEGDIRKYYAGLWRRLSPGAKQALHLIAGTDFHWPADGLRRCAGPIDEIDYLLEHRRAGLIPFHGSILAYARDLPEHGETFRSRLRDVIDWLERDAPEFWRWGWLWIMKAKAGDAAELLKHTTRNWVVTSLTSGWAREQIIAILRDAEQIAFKTQDYCRTIELRTLKTRLLNGPKYQCNRYAEFQETAVRYNRNRQQLLHLADSLGTLSEEEVVTLSRCAVEDNQDIRSDCTTELARKVNLWLALRHRPEQEFITLTGYFLEAVALDGQTDVRRVLRFLRNFRDPDEMLAKFLQLLTRERRLETLEAMLRVMIGRRWQSWRELTQTAIVRVAALEGIDLGARLEFGTNRVAPLLACYLKYQKAQTQPKPSLRVVAVGVVRKRYDYGRVPSLEGFFHDVFFAALAAKLFGLPQPDWETTLKATEKSDWVVKAARLLRDCAMKISTGELQLSFATPYYAAQTIEPISERPSEPEMVQYIAFKHALRQIALDLHCLRAPAGKRCLLNAEELARARKSAHWVEEMWVADQVERGYLLLDRPRPSASRYDLGPMHDKKSPRQLAS